MAVSNYTMPFNIHNTQQQPIRNRPDRYAQSPLAERFRFEVSEGIRPAEYLGIYKYLPVLQKDVTTEDYIVVPKGRVVSALSSESSLNGAMTTPSGAGSIYSFTSAVDGLIKTRSVDNSFYGYDEDINGLIVPCNGGTATNHYYTSNDVTNGTISPSGNLVSAGEVLALPANYPIGVVYHDWYQDIRGKWLNYQMWPEGGHVLCDWYVEVPYVKVNTLNNNYSPLGSGVTPVASHASATLYNTKYDINKKFTYLEVDMDTDTFQPGVFIKSDQVGNYEIQGTGNRTVQTIGRLISIDNRYPKNGMEDVQTYPGSNMPGTQTAGLPSFLFEFVYACQSLTGTAPTVEQILSLVQAGYYGVAKIQLSIA